MPWKGQKRTEFGRIIFDHDGTPDRYSGIVSVTNGVLTLGTEDDTDSLKKENESLTGRNLEIDDTFISLYADKAQGILTEKY